MHRAVRFTVSQHPDDKTREPDWTRSSQPTDPKSGDQRVPTSPAGPVARALATLDSGYFAWVMASGIVSVGTDLLGFRVFSQVSLGVTIFAFVFLVVAYAIRFIAFRPWAQESLRDATTAMAYFTVVAGTDVLAVRLLMAGHTTVALGLGAAAAIVWLVLTYGLPWSIVARAHRPVLGEFNGTWLVWVVGTQSLAIIAAGLSPHAPSDWLATGLPIVAICLWGIGVMLYLILVVIIFLRLLVIEVTPAEMGPAYWIAMGAMAISVRAAAGILALHGGQASKYVAELRPFLIGLSVVFWSFATWWIPLLILFGIWRYVVRGYSRAYEPRLWSMVFPVGMYTVASYTLGTTAGFGFMVSVARAWVWAGMVAWVAVLGLMVIAMVRALSHRGHSAA